MTRTSPGICNLDFIFWFWDFLYGLTSTQTLKPFFDNDLPDLSFNVGPCLGLTPFLQKSIC